MNVVENPRVRLFTDKYKSLCFKHAVKLAQKEKDVKIVIEDTNDYMSDLQCSICRKFVKE